MARQLCRAAKSDDEGLPTWSNDLNEATLIRINIHDKHFYDALRIRMRELRTYGSVRRGNPRKERSRLLE